MWILGGLLLLTWCVGVLASLKSECNKFPPVFRSMASHFARFSSSSRQNVVDSRGVAKGVRNIKPLYTVISINVVGKS